MGSVLAAVILVWLLPHPCVTSSSLIRHSFHCCHRSWFGHSQAPGLPPWPVLTVFGESCPVTPVPRNNLEFVRARTLEWGRVLARCGEGKRVMLCSSRLQKRCRIVLTGTSILSGCFPFATILAALKSFC